MPTWFREPHKRYGTSYRLINLIVLLQIVAIVGSRGETYTLGEAYAFGVIWSFAFKALAVAVLRFKDQRPRMEGALQPPSAGTSCPSASARSRRVSSPRLRQPRDQASGDHQRHRLHPRLLRPVRRVGAGERAEARRQAPRRGRRVPPRVPGRSSAETVGVRPGNALCLVRDYNTLDHLKWALEARTPARRTSSPSPFASRRARTRGTGPRGLVFASYEQLLFSRVVALAEKAGKKVHLLVVPSSNVFDAVVQTAAQLDSADIWAGRSSVMTPEDQAQAHGRGLGAVAEEAEPTGLLSRGHADGTVRDFTLARMCRHSRTRTSI